MSVIMTNYQNKSDSKSSTWEPKFKGSCKALEDHFFYYGRKMDQKCLSSSKEFIQYVGEKIRESAKQSILQNELVIMEVTKPRTFMKKKYLRQFHTLSRRNGTKTIRFTVRKRFLLAVNFWNYTQCCGDCVLLHYKEK